MSVRIRPFVLPSLSAIICLVLAVCVQAKLFRAPTVKFVLEDGAKVSDRATITVKAATPDDSGIEKVEFYVDNKLRFTDTSVPYEYEWDTLADTEGTHAIKAIAFDA